MPSKRERFETALAGLKESGVYGSDDLEITGKMLGEDMAHINATASEFEITLTDQVAGHLENADYVEIKQRNDGKIEINAEFYNLNEEDEGKNENL